ncbi:MAG: PD-(D/E)XK nuclease family protein [Synergistaceae bacterium]|nr:PD-(D/E)XK nuclease family protein [Synergistaceae bacterium]
MNRKCFVNVSDLAICQRCPALFAMKIHEGDKSVWSIGIQGNGQAYGSIFHKNIAQKFFKAAAHPENPLHLKIARSISSETLEETVRKNIFMPFIAENSQKFSSGQLLAMAKGVKIWVKAMSDYFINIPSLINDPVKNMRTVFKMPEQKLRSFYDLEGGRLVVVGCYDALMFNPDRAEARLIEFKGYSKSDITVPLSQSLIYAWLIYKITGIIPSVEIIYLDDADKAPDAFSSKNVSAMIKSGLPELFHAAFDIITLRRYPKILHDKKLCEICKYNQRCKFEIDKIFMRKKRLGASLISVLAFMFAAVLTISQVFFILA